MNIRFALLAVALAGALGAPAGAAPCSKETLTVRGVPVVVQYCIAGDPQTSGAATVVAVDSTYTSGDASFARRSTLRFISGEGPGSVLESVDLAGLGLTGTLHLTLGYAGGEVHVLGALLTPGAVIVK